MAASLKRSAEGSHQRKGTPLQSEMSMLTCYIENLLIALVIAICPFGWRYSCSSPWKRRKDERGKTPKPRDVQVRKAMITTRLQMMEIRHA
ncbi:DUF3175 domain-containing protein [Novosphingobium terrae]|uniref:DUF3175 domain-containing protein n=1 Tax=Novosphingobium terrae TaxID=2726189 RepID=UPI001F13643A|nr:DUF3175 domain-containing protein [Novosphingobium terrae]